MFSAESTSHIAAFKNECHQNGAIPKIVSSKISKKSFEQRQKYMKSESQTSIETINSYNFRTSRCKYASLIDQSDIKWWTDIHTKRLAATKNESVQQTNTESTETESKEKTDIEHLSKAPICCPIMDCKIYFLSNDMMMHFLGYHKQPEAALHRVFEKQQLLISFKPIELTVGEVCCVGLVSYAGKKLESKAASVRNLWLPQNLKLCQQFLPLMNDYPIFMLASIMPMDIFRCSRAELEEVGSNICTSMLVFWLVGAYINTKIYYTMTAYNQQLTNSQSGIYSVRTLTGTQFPSEFCSQDCNYFRLTFKELYALLRDEKTLEVELVFQECLESIDE